MDIAAKYWEYVRSVIQETGEKSYKPFPAFEAGVMSERERIIALLALEVCDECYNIPVHSECGYMSLAIALIKGDSE